MSGGLMPVLRFIVPEGIDDAERVSGGNVYDRRLRDALRDRGVDVRTSAVPTDRLEDLAAAIAAIPDNALVLIDGLLAVPGAAVLAAHSARLRVVVLAHMVASAMLGIAGPGRTARDERAALRAAHRVIATSEWTRSELVRRGFAEPDRIAVARPGGDPVGAAAGSESGVHLLCIGAVAEHKGQDLLVAALAGAADLPGWTCSIVGSSQVEPAYARRLIDAIDTAGLRDRVALGGVLTGARLGAAYDAADLVVAPSRAESYGMVVAEALARGIPVVAARVGGIPEATGAGRAAVLVPPDDAAALGAALRRWLEDAGGRAALKAEALRSRRGPSGWSATTDAVVRALRAAPAETAPRRSATAGPRRGAA